MAKGYMRFSVFVPGFCLTSPLNISNSSISCSVKTFPQAEWVPMRGLFIHFAMTDHQISKFIAVSTSIKIRLKNLILILLYMKGMF